MIVLERSTECDGRGTEHMYNLFEQPYYNTIRVACDVVVVM